MILVGDQEPPGVPPPRGSSLLALLLCRPFRLDSADVRFCNRLVPVLGSFLLAFRSGYVSSFYVASPGMYYVL